MAAYNKYTAAIGPLLKAINVASDTYKIALAATVNSAELIASHDYKAIEARMRAEIQAEIDDEEDLLVML